MLTKNKSEIDRKTASKILGVSVRTIDRYIRSGKLDAKRENGRIWLAKRDVNQFPEQNALNVTPIIDKGRFVNMSTYGQKQLDVNFYRDLYEEAKRALHDYQQKLEQSNYRIGQLESQIMHPSNAPKIIEKTEQNKNDFQITEMIRRDMSEKDKEISSLKESIQKEKSSSAIFATLTYILLAAISVIWYFLR